MAVYDYEIGSTYVGMANLEDLTVPLPAPKHTWQDYSQVVPMADGSVRGLGWPLATWHWGFLTQAQRDQLKTFCADLSAEVYIQTRIGDGTYDVFTAVMVWPQQEEKRAGRIQDFTVTFQRLEEYP